MSTFPASVEAGSFDHAKTVGLSRPQAAGLVTALSVLGISTIWSVANMLWAMWMQDALKSIGMFIPLISLVLILRVWRSLAWEMEGSWSGLAVLIVTTAVVHLREQAVLVFVLSPHWSISVPPPGLVAFAFGTGVVLLFGGLQLFRASFFSLALLWFVNPIPHIFNEYVDLPLQSASAHVARNFAIGLGQTLSPDHLKLMFTPKFGMFIAPGCNGIRGAVTMGLIALIAGYVYRFRWYAHVAVITGAVLLGYVFNFARLCVLVLYYMVALHVTWLQNKAELADYVIGACLFLGATILLFHVIASLGQSPTKTKPPVLVSSKIASVAVPASFYARFAAMLVVVLFGWFGVARVYARTHTAEYIARTGSERNAQGRFPERIGSYSLSRTWNEAIFAGPLVYHWADYAPSDGGPHVALGISPILGSHEILLCHLARGEAPLWRGQLTLPTVGGRSLSLSSLFFNTGVTQSLEANTVCNETSCGEYGNDRMRFGFLYSKPTTRGLLSEDSQRTIPVLLKAETTDATLSTEVARQQMIAALRSFVAAADLKNLTQTYRQP